MTRHRGWWLRATGLLIPSLTVLLAGCSGSGGSSGSNRSLGPAGLGAIQVRNDNAQTGTAVVEVVVPLQQGQGSAVPNVRTEHGAVCQARRLGATWPDGSLRYVALDVPVTAGPNHLETIQLKVTKEQDPPFQVHSAVAGAGGHPTRLVASFKVGGTDNAFGAMQLLEDGPTVRVYRSTVRARNSMMFAQLDVHLYSNLPHARFILTWANSDPSDKRLWEDPGQVWFEVEGARLVVDEAPKEKGRVERQGRTSILLHQGGGIADGQAQAFEGCLLFAGEDPPRLHALSKRWVVSRAFGPFGELLPGMMPKQEDFDTQVRADRTAQVSDAWAEPHHGCSATPANTGDQPDFGTIVMRPDVLLADPARLPSIRRSIYQETCRPTHFWEQDLLPVTVQGHPKLVTHRGRPHWRGASWVDTLGKQRAYLTTVMRTPNNVKWTGHDSEHWSVNYLCAYAMTTGHRWALQEVDHKVELWLSQFTHQSGTGNDSPGPARSTGRSLLAGCWLYLITGREDLKKRILERYGQLRPAMAQPRPSPTNKLKVLKPRWDKTRGYYWAPWEEAIAVTGMLAVHRVFGNEDAKKLALELSEVITMHAYGRKDGQWRIGYKIPFEHPNGKPYVALDDPKFDKEQGAGSGLTKWGLPAVLVALDLSPHENIRARAREILRDRLANIDGMSSMLQWTAMSSSVLTYATHR